MSVENQKVLIVDDDPAMLRLLAKWLEGAGYETQRAGDGRQAIAAIETECPHILITDWEMPHLDGLELCRWLRSQRLPHYVYSVFLTVRSSLADIIKGLDAGADDFLKKPIDRGELLARLKSGERLVELERRLSAMAFSDSLTGLATQRAFYEHLHREWHRSLRYSLPLSCVMIDVDFFKRVNDTHGHPVGDDVLRHVADVLRENVRGGDIACRYGGEEFCVVLPETDERQAVQWAERVREIIARSQVHLATNRTLTQLTASLGVAQRLDSMKKPEELVEHADQALLVAKHAGRDRVVPFQSINDGELSGEIERSLTATLDKVPARAAMTDFFAALNQNANVGQAAKHLLRHQIGSTPIVDDAGQLVGIVSERDLIATTPLNDWWTTPIRNVMKQNVVCYEEDTPVSIIYDFLGRVSLRNVVIVCNGQPIGMLSRAGLLRWFTNQFEHKRACEVWSDERPRDSLKSIAVENCS